MSKPELVTIVVYPSGADADALTVADAMQQVLDIFQLLSKAELQKTGAQQVVWQLERASTNSPLTISAVAVASDPEGTADREAHLAKTALGAGWTELLRAHNSPPWIDKESEKIVRRILDRTLNGIGRTDIRFEDDLLPVVIDHPSALRAISYLEMRAAEAAAQIEDLTRAEFGSVEGDVVGITTHYKKPAFVLRGRLSGKEVKCVLGTAAADKIGSEHDWREAWTGERVLVRGQLHYNSVGDLVKVDADDLEKIVASDLSAKEIQDPTYSGGNSPVQHLDKLWGEPDA